MATITQQPAPVLAPAQPRVPWYKTTGGRIIIAAGALFLLLGIIGAIAGGNASGAPGSSALAAMVQKDGYGSIKTLSASDIANLTGAPASDFVGAAEGYKNGQAEEVVQFTDAGAASFDFAGFQQATSSQYSSVMNGNFLVATGSANCIDNGC